MEELSSQNSQEELEELSSYRSRVLSSGATYNIFLVPPLSAEQLPVLTAANAAQFLEWHLYVRRIYGPEPPFPIDLNTFTWFYWDCPLRLKNIYLGDWV